MASGQRVMAAKVVSAIEARTTFEQLLSADEVPVRLLRRLHRREISLSVVSIHVGTDLDARALGAHHETVLARNWDIERIYADGVGGRLSGAFVVIPSLTDPSLAPSGEHVVMIQAIATRESGETSTDERSVADDLLGFGEDVLPGLRQHLTFVEPDSSDTASAYPRVHRLGPIYGWSNAPANTGPRRRLAPITPTDGLLLAGHWTQPGYGMFVVIESGIQAAWLVLGANAAAPPLPLGLSVTQLRRR